MTRTFQKRTHNQKAVFGQKKRNPFARKRVFIFPSKRTFIINSFLETSSQGGGRYILEKKSISEVEILENAGVSALAQSRSFSVPLAASFPATLKCEKNKFRDFSSFSPQKFGDGRLFPFSFFVINIYNYFTHPHQKGGRERSRNSKIIREIPMSENTFQDSKNLS